LLPFTKAFLLSNLRHMTTMMIIIAAVIIIMSINNPLKVKSFVCRSWKHMGGKKVQRHLFLI